MMGGVSGIDKDVAVVAVDVFGTTVDWRTGLTRAVTEITAASGVSVDAGDLVDDWRGRYLPTVELIQRGELPWMNLDGVHRHSLDELLSERDLDAAFDEPERERLVLAWHHLPPWSDAAMGLARLRERCVVAAFSNGGFALLTTLVKSASLPFDCIVSAELFRCYKPDVRSYRAAARLLDQPPERCLMVACHAWDIQGARAAGLATAFVERPSEKGPHRKGDRPADADADIAVSSFEELADALEA